MTFLLTSGDEGLTRFPTTPSYTSGESSKESDIRHRNYLLKKPWHPNFHLLALFQDYFLHLSANHILQFRELFLQTDYELKDKRKSYTLYR